MPQPGEPAACVVVPEFVVKPGCIVSLADEPGCRQFDSVQMDGASRHVLFYEVYDSRAAFDAHLGTPHLARFREGFPTLVPEERPVRVASHRHG